MHKTEPVVLWVAVGQALAVAAEVYMPASGVWHGLMAGLSAFVARSQVRPDKR